MTPRPACSAALICWRLDDGLVAQLRAHGYTVDAAVSESAVIDVLRRYPSPVLLFALPADGDGRSTWEMLDAVHAECPGVSPIAVAISGYSSYASAFHGGGRRLAGLVTAAPTFDLDDLARALRKVERTRVIDDILDALGAVLTRPLSDPATTILRRALRLAHEPVSMDALATACKMHERTLRKHWTRHGLPEPQRFIAWARTLRVAQLLDDRDSTTAAVAEALGFPSPAAMRKLLARCTGTSLARLRLAGALHVACLRLEEEWYAEVSEPPKLALVR